MLVVYRLITSAFNFYNILIVAYCLMSWLPVARATGIVRDACEAVAMVVEPYLGLFRRFIPPFGGVDFSPVIAILALQFIERFLLRIIL